LANLTPMFSISDIAKRIDEFAEARINESIQVLQYVGENFVNRARRSGTYTDRTGNLRASIGYVIIYNGKIQNLNVTGKGDGSEQANKFAKEITSKFNEGLVLVVFAGMEYAAAVESLGYDVISGSQPMAAELLRELKQELGAR
jgi:hypothetical protein